MTSEEILKEIRAIFGKKWNTRDGRQVPEAKDVALGNDAVTLSGTVLYADMADSTGLVNGFRPWFAAEVYKAYLLGACRVIRNNAGEITAFDGDRVMAAFIGDYKNTSAVKAALQINFLVTKTNEMLRAAYPTTAYTLRQTVGIDTSDLFVARTGIRMANDLVWVGRAANYAAKLSALGEQGFPTYITDDVFTKLSNEGKFGGPENKPMWEKRIWTERQMTVYRSSWWWKI
ncbi:MAG: adenylate/guanylate cyclase domain-containing protein [Kiritimatiellia bacterium]